jgi:alanine racemase
MRNTSYAKIDLQAIRANLLAVRSLCPRSRILAMLKADGYGHGLVQTARALAAADGLGVARLEEALTLRASGITAQRILVMATLLDAGDLATASNQNIDVVAHDVDSVEAVLAQAARGPLRVWLELDSGMHRTGLDPSAFSVADRKLSVHPGILELIHMSHFSAADCVTSPTTSEQLSVFSQCHEFSTAKVSVGNSAALLTRSEARADWVRPGIMLYGVNPVRAYRAAPLRAAMSLRSRVIAVRSIGIGEAVGYNQRWTAKQVSRIATVGIGYGDGYPRHARNGTPVGINGVVAPLVGQVSMDSLTIDISSVGPVAVGDEVILWGSELPVNTVAEHADTIPYHLLTGVSNRVHREYTPFDSG